MRIQNDRLYLEVCNLIGMRTKCQRRSVGCVITIDDRIVATGYNGPIQHECQGTCDTSKACTDAVHAEANAIAFAARYGVQLKGSTLYCNWSPCYECAKLIIQAGIKEVIFYKYYPGTGGTDLLRNAGIITKQWMEPNE